MIMVKCDRCEGDMDPNGMIGYMSWCFKQGVDGDLGVNELEGRHYCERCMDEVMALIQSRVSWETQQSGIRPPRKPYEKPEIIEEKKNKPRISKEKGEAILELKKRGFKIKEIAEELEMEPVQVKNWLYNHKGKTGEE